MVARVKRNKEEVVASLNDAKKKEEEHLENKQAELCMSKLVFFNKYIYLNL